MSKVIYPNSYQKNQSTINSNNKNNHQNQNQNLNQHTLTQQKLYTFKAALLISKSILKNKLHERYSNSFLSIRSYTIKKHKNGIYLANKLSFLFKKKYSQRREQFWNVLLNLKLQSHFKNDERIQKLKKFEKLKATEILLPLTLKIWKNKIKNCFSELKFRTLLVYKLQIYKILHFSNVFDKLKRTLMKDFVNKLRVNSFRTVIKGKSFYHFEKFMNEKPKSLLIQAFQILKSVQKKQTPSKQIPKVQLQKQTPQNNVLSELTASQEQKQFEQKKALLQAELKQIQKNNRISKQKLQKQVQKLESQFQGLKFNNDVLEQDNKQLQKAVQLRQTRGKKRLSQKQVWESVYYNLLAFLNSKQHDSVISVKKEQIISVMEVPLVQCGIKLDQLIQQNKVLQQLLSAYRQNFPEPQSNTNLLVNHLPYQIIKKQNKYYFQSIQILSGWGTNDEIQVNQLKSQLAQLRKQFQ